MKRVLSIVSVVAVLSACAIFSHSTGPIAIPNPFTPIVLYAQSLPSTRTITWNPVAATVNAISYSVAVDGAPPIVFPITASLCTATVCTATIPIATFAQHTIAIATTNSALTGDPASVIPTPQTGPFSSLVTFILNQIPSLVSGLGIR